MVSRSVVALRLFIAVVLISEAQRIIAAEHPNFDLLNSYPKVPVYYKIDNEPTWQELKQGHVSRNVLAQYLALTLSATKDDSHPTYFVFSPQPAEIAIPASQSPLKCYIQVNACSAKDIRIVPQNAASNSQKTTLSKNVTCDLIRQFKELAIAQRAGHCDKSVPTHAQIPATSITTGTPIPIFYTASSEAPQGTMPQAIAAPLHAQDSRSQLDAFARSLDSIQQRIQRVLAAYGTDRISDATASGDDASHRGSSGIIDEPQVQTETWQCSVCLGDQGQERITLSCGHTFHVACIAEWKAKNPTCPICRTPID